MSLFLLGVLHIFHKPYLETNSCSTNTVNLPDSPNTLQSDSLGVFIQYTYFHSAHFSSSSYCHSAQSPNEFNELRMCRKESALSTRSGEFKGTISQKLNSVLYIAGHLRTNP
jgi:hypothetical protein